MRYVIGDREASQILAYCDIARAHHSALKLSELVNLMSIEATEEDLERAWLDNHLLNTKYLVSSGYVVEKNVTIGDAVNKEAANRERAKKNLFFARQFARLCVDGTTKLLAVSGGNSYRSAREGDDVDFFCVTDSDSLWVFMLKSLILARLYRINNRSPQLCFSYAMDEGKVRAEFGEARDRLFARDALSAQVLSGQSFYRSLLGGAQWMDDHFPKMYRDRLTNERDSDEEAGTIRKPGNRVLNYFLYQTVGRYVRVKAFIANERCRKRRDSLAIFRVRIGKDHCIYESNRYARLREKYSSPERAVAGPGSREDCVRDPRGDNPPVVSQRPFGAVREGPLRK